MKHFVFATLLVVSITPLASPGGITLDIEFSSAPNAFGSPSWGAYASNALSSLQNNSGNIGDRNTDPTAYELAGATVDPGDVMVSSFNMWRGNTSPASPFDQEYGNRLHCGLHAYGDGSAQFRLEDLTFAYHSSDPGDGLIFTGDFIGFNYNGTTRFGVDWGADNAPGGGDDTVYNSGNGTTLVDEIVYVGVGNAFWPGTVAEVADTVAYFAANQPFNVSCEYDILGTTNIANVLVTPEPGSLLLISAGLLVVLRRRR